MNKLLPILILLIAGLGCSNTTKVSTGPSDTAQPGSSTDTRRYTINQTKSFGNLEMTIGEIAVEKGKVTIGVTMVNKSKETLTCYPDQGELVVGKIQYDSNLLQSTGGLGGEIHPGVEKRGNMAFYDQNESLSLDDVNQINLRLGTVYGDNILRSTKIDWTINLNG